MINQLLMVGLGGGIGSILRFIVQKSMHHGSSVVFPTGTFIVNITGCLLIGLFWGWSTKNINWSEEMKMLLMTGFCGGFTTFSAFTLEGVALLKENKILLFVLYAGGSVLLGLLATYFGMRLTR
jgi:fluoride exporter